MANIHKVTPFLWYDKEAQEAATFYTSIFKNSKIIDSNPMMVTFELEGQRIMALNGGPHYKINEAFSLFVQCEDQEEVDYFWNKFLKNSGEESRCGWLKDKFGVSWQIIPNQLGELMGGPDREKADRVTQVMLKMKKLDIATLQKAYEGK